MSRRHRVIDQPIHDLATHSAKHITVNVLAEYLEVRPRTITRMIMMETLSASKVGREWRILTSEARLAFPGLLERKRAGTFHGKQK